MFASIPENPWLRSTRGGILTTKAPSLIEPPVRCVHFLVSLLYQCMRSCVGSASVWFDWRRLTSAAAFVLAGFGLIWRELIAANICLFCFLITQSCGCTCTHVCICASYMYTSTYIHTSYIYIYTQMDKSACLCVTAYVYHMHTYIHTSTHTYTSVLTREAKDTGTATLTVLSQYIHAYIHIHIQRNQRYRHSNLRTMYSCIQTYTYTNVHKLTYPQTHTNIL